MRLPDGSPLTLQDWMTRPEAELFPTVLQPGIAPRALAHLHDIVSDFLLSVDRAGGGDDGTEEVRKRTLFDQEGPDGLLRGERRERLVLLMTEMIRQAATGRDPDGKEVRDEQDHD